MGELLAVEGSLVGAALLVAADDDELAADDAGALDIVAALLLDDPLDDPAVDPAPLGDALLPLDVPLEELPTVPVVRPLSFSVVSTCFCTSATCATTWSGVAPAPRERMAFSLASAAFSLAMTSADGCCDRVTTI